MEEIARRSGVSPPVVYDHFASKLELHRRLLERTRNQLLEMWREHLFGDDAPADVRFSHAIEAWAMYIEDHPYAARMYFRGGAGDAEAEAVHREIQDQARVALGVLLSREPGVEHIAGPGQEELEMAAEVIRSGLTGLAMWWSDHPHVPREQIVRTAVNVLWRGLERAREANKE